jgi:DNA-directed RNA polymerase subunit N (RpoN/RPB10)
MDKERLGSLMVVYTLGDGKMTDKLRVKFTNCKKMILTHSTMSSMMKNIMR